MTSQILSHSLDQGSRRHNKTLSTSLAMRLLRRILSAIEIGSLVIEMPSGERLRNVVRRDGPEAVLVIHHWRSLRRLASKGSIGFAEAYIDGDWSSPDLTTLIELAALNTSALDRLTNGSRLMRGLQRIAHLLKANTRSGSRRNIAAHYDLGNDFYAAWLDRSMTYSSALYTQPDMSLEYAQDRKLARIAELLDLKDGSAVLEIGCGWGALATKLAAEHDTSVVALTLSKEQHDLAGKRAAEHGLSEHIDVRLQDYRDVSGQFDRVVSIEMFEAVGEAYWPVYFQALRKLLKPQGRAVLQVITIAEDRYKNYRASADFIQHYIFPGGMLPSKTVLRNQLTRAGLRLTHMETFGDSYARTLADWRDRFHAAWPAIERMGFDNRFRRMWHYYLCYCEAGFRTGAIDVGFYVAEA